MKNFLVIGGSSGIGKAIVQELDVEGHRVYATFNKHESADSERVSYHQLNVSSDDFSLNFLPAELEGLVYCPGTINLKPFARIKPVDFVTDYELQVIGAVKVLQLVLPALKQSGNAAVLFFSTIAVQSGFSFHSLVSASKGAIEGLTRSLAAELAPAIRVNCIAPSITDTPLAAALLSTDEKRNASIQRHPLKRIGLPGDISRAASFLLTEATWMTGQVLHVDGGLSNLKLT
ncbi:SDR family oxidoreductase [Segetibacter sp. 3557_3]|uniref:SDR family NAD(P)-dependent oxidoreductase n=1 Tax=Segetibacter sp. 3557_3 TaxID=2547429 RepID=UPI00105890BF|nr:SDR family oxidoreductase [Segetibacter sp. 3557_3]TDH27948.1 SDR family oxidoreductase [Segetibacter sp. 3557_3]